MNNLSYSFISYSNYVNYKLYNFIICINHYFTNTKKQNVIKVNSLLN